MTGYKASGYTSSSSSRNSLTSTRPINRYDGLESSCCMGSNLPRFPSLHSETLSHQWQDATLVAENSKRLIHVRAYIGHQRCLPRGSRSPYSLFTELPRVSLPELQQRLAADPPARYDTPWW